MKIEAKENRISPRSLNKYVVLLMIPGILMLGLFTFYPIVKMFIMSFFDWKIGFQQTSPFVGFQNYINVVKDPLARHSLVNTLFYLAITVPGQIIFGLFIAVLIQNISRGTNVLKVLFYLPVVTSWVVVALLFRYIFSNDGLLNYFLTDVLHFLPEKIKWLGSRWPAMTGTVILGVWKGIGWNMVIFIAAINSIPEQLYEAAAIDGTTTIQNFFYITLPNIRKTLVFALVMLTIGAFNTYTPIAVMTEGNPAHQTDVILTWMYHQTFDNLKMGYSSALSFIMAVFIAGFTILFFFVLNKEGRFKEEKE